MEEHQVKVILLFKSFTQKYILLPEVMIFMKREYIKSGKRLTHIRARSGNMVIIDFSHYSAEKSRVVDINWCRIWNTIENTVI